MSAARRRALRSSRGEEGREGEVQAKRRSLGRRGVGGLRIEGGREEGEGGREG